MPVRQTHTAALATAAWYSATCRNVSYRGAAWHSEGGTVLFPRGAVLGRWVVAAEAMAAAAAVILAMLVIVLGVADGGGLGKPAQVPVRSRPRLSVRPRPTTILFRPHRPDHRDRICSTQHRATDAMRRDVTPRGQSAARHDQRSRHENEHSNRLRGVGGALGNVKCGGLLIFSHGHE